MKEEFIVKNLEELNDVAKKIVTLLQTPVQILVKGQMGVGKTTFCQALGKALGIKNKINSPTFNLLKIYHGTSKTLYHIDYYRLENNNKDDGLDLDSLCEDEEGIMYVEWSEYMSKSTIDGFPNKNYLTIELIENEYRKLTFED